MGRLPAVVLEGSGQAACSGVRGQWAGCLQRRRLQGKVKLQRDVRQWPRPVCRSAAWLWALERLPLWRWRLPSSVRAAHCHCSRTARLSWGVRVVQMPTPASAWLHISAEQPTAQPSTLPSSHTCRLLTCACRSALQMTTRRPPARPSGWECSLDASPQAGAGASGCWLQSCSQMHAAHMPPCNRLLALLLLQCWAPAPSALTMHHLLTCLLYATDSRAGYALGYIFGGLVGGALGWRAAFLIEAAAMLPFVVFCLRAPPINLRGSSSSSGGSGGGSVASSSAGCEGSGHGTARPAPLLARLRSAARTIASDVALLLRHPVYVWTVAGMTVYTAVLGAFAFYGPKAGRDVFAIAPERADITFGAITVLTGTLPVLLRP